MSQERSTFDSASEVAQQLSSDAAVLLDKSIHIQRSPIPSLFLDGLTSYSEEALLPQKRHDSDNDQNKKKQKISNDDDHEEEEELTFSECFSLIGSVILPSKRTCRLDVPQLDSAEGHTNFLKKRRGKFSISIGSSDVGVLMGFSKYAGTPITLWEYLCYLLDTDEPSKIQSEPCQHGNETESLTLSAFEYFSGIFCFQSYIWIASSNGCSKAYPDYADHLHSASPDALVLKRTRLLKHRRPVDFIEKVVELKSPYGDMYETILDTHICQVVWQIYVVGTEIGDYFACKVDRKNSETPGRIRKILYQQIHPTKKAIETLVNLVDSFNIACIEKDFSKFKPLTDKQKKEWISSVRIHTILKQEVSEHESDHIHKLCEKASPRFWC